MIPFTHDLESLGLTPVTMLLFSQIVREETVEAVQHQVSEVLASVREPCSPVVAPSGPALLRYLWRERKEVEGVGESISGD